MTIATIRFVSACRGGSEMSDITDIANNTATKNGRYSYDSVLGEGSFGNVLKACDTTKNEPVAVKLVKVQNRTAAEVLLFS